MNDDTVQVYVPVPETYPETPFARYCRKTRRGRFAEAGVQIRDADRIRRKYRSRLDVDLSPFEPIEDEDMDESDILVIFLDNFAVYSQSPHGYRLSSDEEKHMLRGIGKMVLCDLANLFTNEISDPRKAFLVVEVSGAKEDNVEACKQRVSHLSERDLLYDVFQNYRSELIRSLPDIRYLTERDTTENVLAGLYCRAEANSLLVDYYTRRFGLQLWQESVSATDCVMGATLQTILDHCR